MKAKTGRSKIYLFICILFINLLFLLAIFFTFAVVFIHAFCILLGFGWDRDFFFA